jgi:hypothetical protein
MAVCSVRASCASGLRSAWSTVIVRRVKFSRPVLIAFLLPLLLLPGCQSYFERKHGPLKKYYRVRVTNPRGELVADYISEGKPSRTERGFVFKAMERTSHPPEQLTLRYPHGRRIEVAGPNIVVARSGKPLWLYEIDGY